MSDLEEVRGVTAEEALRKSEEKYRTLFETMAQGVVYQAADGRIISANPAAERILGLSLKQMQGRSSMDPRWRAMREDGSDFPGDRHPAMEALRTGKEPGFQRPVELEPGLAHQGQQGFEAGMVVGLAADDERRVGDLVHPIKGIGQGGGGLLAPELAKGVGQHRGQSGRGRFEECPSAPGIRVGHAAHRFTSSKPSGRGGRPGRLIFTNTIIYIK